MPRALFLTEGPRDSNSVRLTFDDGPHPELTPRLLDILGREKIHATFFLVGSLAQRYPDIVRRIALEGHAVGHHSHSHVDPRVTPSAVMRQDVHRSRRVLQDILGSPVRLYRPPKCVLRPLEFLDLWLFRQTIVLWNVDPKDFLQTSAEDVVKWFQSRPLRGGDVVLLHDSVPHTVAALPFIVAEALRAGLQFDTMEHLTRWPAWAEIAQSSSHRL